jgi:hypothetical protein
MPIEIVKLNPKKNIYSTTPISSGRLKISLPRFGRAKNKVTSTIDVTCQVILAHFLMKAFVFGEYSFIS